MSKIITQCPSCSCSSLHVVKIECSNCNTRFEGKFDIPDLLKFSEDDLEFILNFVKCSGSLKDMAIQQKISYPTLRNKLNILIQTIENIGTKQEYSKDEILQLLEAGKISTKDAATMLQKL
ncbi:MAG: DUF2089 family protein [Rickettsiaceae bacterium]|nr:DUF2089 family protein [Rickettsiaceae bacterium]